MVQQSIINVKQVLGLKWRRKKKFHTINETNHTNTVNMAFSFFIFGHSKETSNNEYTQTQLRDSARVNVWVYVWVLMRDNNLISF